MQECLVRTIAEAEWRLRRAGRAEVGEIRRQTDSYYARQSLDFCYDDGLLESAFWSREENKRGVRNTALRIEAKLGLLAQVRKNLEERGYVGEGVQKALDSAYGKDHTLAARCHRFSQLVHYQQADERESLGRDGEEGHTVGDHLDQQKDGLLVLIELHIQALKESLINIEQAEAREQEASLLACNLPSREFVDKLIRYETALVNKKERAIKLLLRLQGK
jgi:hypothetical protein